MELLSAEATVTESAPQVCARVDRGDSNAGYITGSDDDVDRRSDERAAPCAQAGCGNQPDGACPPCRDATLVALAVGGSLAAWQQIVERHQPAMHAAGRRLGLPPDDIADIVQWSWLRAYQHLSELRDTSKLRPWLLSIMRNEFHRLLRRPSRRREHLMDVTTAVDFPDESADVEEQVIRADRCSDLRRALAGLGRRERDMLCALASGYSYPEVAKALSMPIGSIGPTRIRAIRRLRAMLDADQGDRRLAA